MSIFSQFYKFIRNFRTYLLQVKEIFKQFKLLVLNQEKDIEAKLVQKYNIDAAADGSKSSRVGTFGNLLIYSLHNFSFQPLSTIFTVFQISHQDSPWHD